MLREARERAGFDLTTMARRLHIRPDILRAIEEADFDRMLARGYTKNMIRAYARTVGLDQNQITNLYLDEAHLYETGSPRMTGISTRPRYSSPSRQFDNTRQEPARNRAYRSDESSRYSARYAERYPEERYRDNRQSRNIRSTSVSQRDYSRQYPQNQSRQLRESQDNRNRSSVRSFLNGPGISSSGRPSSRRSSDRGSNRGYNDRGYGNRSIYQSPRGLPNQSGSRWPLLVICAIAAALVIIIVVVVFNSTRQSVNEVPDIPISGLTDTSNPEGVVSTNIANIAPTEATFTYTIEDGGRSWIEIYENGSQKATVSGVLEGPKTETFQVTGTLTFKAANPTPVKVTVNSQEVKLTKESNSNYYSYTVDFAQILRDWEEEHGMTSSSSSSSSSSNASSSSSSSSSRSSSSSSSSASRSASSSSSST